MLILAVKFRKHRFNAQSDELNTSADSQERKCYFIAVMSTKEYWSLEALSQDRVLLAHSMNNDSLSDAHEFPLRLIGSLQLTASKPQGCFNNGICCRTASRNLGQNRPYSADGTILPRWDHSRIQQSGPKSLRWENSLLGIYPALHFLSNLLSPQAQYSYNFSSNRKIIMVP